MTRTRVRTPRQRNVLRGDDYQPQAEAHKQDNGEPPPRRLFVVGLHVVMMAIFEIIVVGAFERVDDVFGVKDGTVGNHATNLLFCKLQQCQLEKALHRDMSDTKRHLQQRWP